MVRMQQLAEGDRVRVSSSFGRSTEGTVAAGWSPGSTKKVSVLLDGRTKAKDVDPAKVSLLERPAPALSSPPKRVTRASTTKSVLHAVPKPPGPFRSDAYLRFVREQPCCGCRSRAVEAHHWGPTRGLGQKVDDTRTVPLCRRCHDAIHATGKLPNLDQFPVPETHRVLLARQVTLLTEWLRRRLAARSAPARAEGESP